MSRNRKASRSSRIAVASLFVALAASVASTAALASDSVRVRPSHDPLKTYERLQGASAMVCGQPNRDDPARYRAWLRCYAPTLQQAVEQMHEMELLAIHRKHLRDGTTDAG